MTRPPRTLPDSQSQPGTDPQRGVRAGAPMGDAARHAAFLAVSRQTRLWPEFDLHAIDSAIDRIMASADERDRAFAHAIYDVSVRRWITLRTLVERHLTRPWDQMDPKLRGGLLACSAQLLGLSRVPASAALNHAVEWVKQQVGLGPSKAANAVLRRVLHDLGGEHRHSPERRRSEYRGLRDELPLGGAERGARVLSSEVLPEPELDRLAVATNHPRVLIEAWLRDRSIADVRNLCLHSMAEVPIVLNVDGTDSGGFESLLADHVSAGNRVFGGSSTELRALLRERTDVWVQDSASCRAVRSLRGLARSPSVIVDLCAGMGTKTRQLEAEFPDATILATDVDVGRANVLERVFERSTNVKVMPPARVFAEWGGRADLVLIDAPCSNTGVLARRPEARFRFSRDTVSSLAAVQRQIIADSIVLLRERPRGSILYSTCSLERAENQDQAVWAAKWHGFKVTRESSVDPFGLPGDPPSQYRDGAYSVLLEG